MHTECDTPITTHPDRDRLRDEWQRETFRAGWPARVAWHSAAVEQCLDALAREGHVRSACLALAKDRAAAEIPLDVALAELDALFLCALAPAAPGPLVRAYLSTRARANPPGTLPPGTDPITELPSAALLQQRLAHRLATGEHTRIVVVRLEVPETLLWGHLRHLLLTARHLERALGEPAHAAPPGRLMALLDGDDPELPDRLDRLCRAPVDPLHGAGSGAPRIPRAGVRLTTAPGSTGR
ncbi:hypothetical protein [Streptomyces sp. SID3343]|uniref:hypothetical protein n=1 Tax=Streptomyces sp. SID3343 TaxID=2690260 RepID=UPI00136B0C50|nr:hypothetical protein [Streptomyces sp. SID3343]MYW00809.1 hypothetical protein [Streptomyces sp. SID3343]